MRGRRFVCLCPICGKREGRSSSWAFLYDNAKFKFGQTPLHAGCQFHASSVVRLLLASGADLYAKDTVRTVAHFIYESKD
jgi:hypothetical protein